MAERIPEKPFAANHHHREPGCIHTAKIYDACKDKDCVEDARVFLTRGAQRVLDRSITVKPRAAELVWVYVDVEPVNFNRGFYSVDAKYFYRVTADAFSGVNRPVEIEGLATFDKRVILYGSEGNAKIYSSRTAFGEADAQRLRRANLPVAYVEVVEPVVLGMKLVERGNPVLLDDALEVPDIVREIFEDELVCDGEEKRLYVTLGQFSIIRLERDSQITVECSEACVPEKECTDHCDDNPCDLFKRIHFPVDDFFPPDRL